ncbi:MAG: hypothetical protein ACI83O_000822 [Patescibacteria group bacterium]|jgi:hypothetical protein
MRRINEKENLAKKQRRYNLYLGIAMIFLLLLSTAGFAFFNQSGEGTDSIQEIEIAGHTFQKGNNIWITNINNKQHAFTYLPIETDIKAIPVNTNKTLANYVNKPLYFVSPDSSKDQILYNLYPEYVLRGNDACINPEICTDDTLPFKTCENDNIIVVIPNNETTRVSQHLNCIILEGSSAQAADAFLHKLLDIQDTERTQTNDDIQINEIVNPQNTQPTTHNSNGM